ncbi:hypothetical protein GT347_15085 [Xylophilus rhododendri]|uniref:Uncharacterized protein n=1 Tax=Xylophilus rhododendri TaxID=2697032 RepID=A0A857J8T6_9BURK|nr:PhaM family polyhydroxyalkanoate granule multifunctional regulatory protein [Xylophilus rhododendri]QHI99185.1 hypothetical protein GT347_15085 [Xylophilus rhododendri]
MSENKPFGFGAFVPGFDFLQGLVQSAAQGTTGGRPPGMPDWSKWVAPTLQPEEIEKRVSELKTVQFWLEQNAKALSATIQALEVQKMSLATLRSMNVPMQDFSQAFGFGQGGAAATAAAPTGGPGRYDDMFTQRPADAPAAPAPAPAPAPEPEAAAAPAPAASPAASPAVDPLQWWNALAGQFQQIAAGAMQEAAARAAQSPGLQDAARQAFDAAGRMAAEVASAAVKPAARPRAKAAPQAPARKQAAAVKKKAVPPRKQAAAAPARKKTAARKTRP